MAIEYTPQDSSPPVTAIDYDPQNTSGLVSDPAEGGSFSASNEAELAGAQSFAAKAKEAQNAAEQSETNAATSAANALASATAAQNLEITSASFNTADGTLTLTKTNSGTVTTDLDGRYLTTHQDISGKANLSGATFTGDVSFNDGVKAKFGTDSDLLIYHNDGEPSVIEDAGELGLLLKTNGNIFSVISDTNESMISAVPDGGVTLYHDNTAKLLVGENAVTISEDLSVSSGNDLNVLGGDLTVTGNAEATEFIGDLRGAVVFKAKAGEALTKGDVVYISGITGNTTVVSKADADNAAKMPAFGLAAIDANNNANLEVYRFGTLAGLDTSSYTEGDELFVGATAGSLVSTAPTGESSFVQKVGKVTRSHASTGSVKIMGAGRTNATPNLNNGNIFIGDSNNQAVTVSFATQVASAETSHTDVLVDGDFTSNGLMKRNGAGVYSVDSSTYATETYVDTAVSGLVDSAPATLDTLNELASALGDDANFSTTVTNSIGTKWTEDATKTGNWDTAYSWGDHDAVGYLTSFDITTQTDPKYLRADADDTTTGTITADGGYNTNNGSFATVTGSITSSYGGITVGGLVTAPNLNISKSGSVTTNIATGAISTPGDTKTLNLGTGFSSQGTTTVNIGSFPTTINLNGNVAVSGTVDGRNVATDGTRLDTIPYHRVRYEKLRYNNATVNLTTAYQNISQTPEIYSPTTSVKCSRYIDFQTEIEWEYISSTNNDLNFKLEVTVPTSSATVTTLGTVTAGNFSGYQVSGFEGWFYVSGDFTHHLTAFGRMNKTGVSNATEVPARAWHYDPINDRTYILTDSNPGFSISTGDTVYWHPYAWESVGAILFVEDTLSERYVGSGSRQNITLRFKTAYDDNQLKYKAYLRELLSTDSAVVRGGEATLTEIEEV